MKTKTLTLKDGTPYEFVINTDLPKDISPDMLEWYNSWTVGETTYNDGKNHISKLGIKKLKH